MRLMFRYINLGCCRRKHTLPAKTIAMGYKAFFLLQLVVYGIAQSAPANDTNATVGRAGRKFGDQPQVISIPIGYYKAPPSQPTSDESESDNDSTPKYSVPTSFDDFVPSDKKPYYASRGESYKNSLPPPRKTYWKGDSANDDNGPTWTVPSPADMMVIMDAMKNTDDQPTGLLSKLTSDPVTTLVAIVIPIGFLLAAVVPALAAFFSNSNVQNVPTVSTTATGTKEARKLADSPSFVKPILEAIEGFSARSGGSTCLQKSFCEATKGSNGTDFRSIRTAIYKTFTFVDDYWLETLGMKQLMEAMGTGDCDKIQCEASPKKKKHGDPQKEH